MAHRTGAPAGAARDGLPGHPQRPVRRDADGHPHADAHQLVPAGGRADAAVRGERRLDRGVPAPATDDDGRGGRVRVTELARGSGPPHPGPMVGAGALPAPDRRGGRAGAARLRLVRRRGDRHPGQLRRDGRGRPRPAAAADGPLGARGKHHPHARRGGLRPERAHRPRRGRRRISRRARERDQARAGRRPGADLRDGGGRMAGRAVLATAAGDRDDPVPVQRRFSQQPVRRWPAVGRRPGRRPAARLLGARPGPAGPVHHQREQRPDRRPRRLPRRGDPG